MEGDRRGAELVEPLDGLDGVEERVDRAFEDVDALPSDGPQPEESLSSVVG